MKLAAWKKESSHSEKSEPVLQCRNPNLHEGQWWFTVDSSYRSLARCAPAPQLVLRWIKNPLWMYSKLCKISINRCHPWALWRWVKSVRGEASPTTRGGRRGERDLWLLSPAAKLGACSTIGLRAHMHPGQRCPLTHVVLGVHTRCSGGSCDAELLLLASS